MNNRSRRDVRRPRSRSNQGRSLIGQEYEVQVGPVAHGGHCVARHEGRVLFVRHALPGEIVIARVTDGGEKSRFLRADAVRVVEASAERVDDGCRFAGPNRCGGCDWQHTSAAYQRELKTSVVREQLQRLAGIDWHGEVQPVPGDDDGAGWRTRVEFTISGSGRLGLRGHRSHDVVKVDDCRIAHPLIGQVGLYTERFKPELSGLDVAVTSESEVVAVELPLDRDDEIPAVAEFVEAGGREHEFEVSARGFWQVHPGAARTFVEHLLARLQPSSGEKVLDLYCGVGLFSAFLADVVGAENVIGIEGVEEAVEQAQQNVPGATFIAGDVMEQLQHLESKTDLVVLDPPRSGAGREVIEAIAERAPRAIAYVACDPAALARDLAYAAQVGYEPVSIEAFDAFPMTHHVECIAMLTPTA
ncbi:class I SAM-dependent RNA methyltransferase [Yimella sp. cx-573]|nr:class I SAM-dependent RNA methyltransferase [Yimella sp. cx-573]